MGILVQLVAGLIFGIGLVVSGMIDPAKVLNFLDFTGTWDPSLVFVMAGAVLVTGIGYRIAFRLRKPLLASAFQLPAAQGFDARILIGPAIFGIGWGMAGLCPGPAITSLGIGSPGVLAFVTAMLAGMAAGRWLAVHCPGPVAAHPHLSTR
jgi:uncharacterized membrane protein YedE/YeeE